MIHIERPSDALRKKDEGQRTTFCGKRIRSHGVLQTMLREVSERETTGVEEVNSKGICNNCQWVAKRYQKEKSCS